MLLIGAMHNGKPALMPVCDEHLKKLGAVSTPQG
jgi:hypothetical protein